MSGTPLIIGEAESKELQRLKALAESNPVDMHLVIKEIITPAGKKKHMAQMTAQTVKIPMGYFVTYSVENGHPMGTCRHMSMSIDRPGRIPNEHAVWLAAEALGFWGGSLEACDHIYLEDIPGGKAINVIQLFERPTTQ